MVSYCLVDLRLEPAMPTTRRTALAVLALSLFAGATLAADATKPHEHRGLLKPYPKSPPPLVLSDSEQQKLMAGTPVMRQTEGEAGGRGLAVFLVNAPADVVWSTIEDFGAYPRFIPEVKKCDVYKKDGRRIDVFFALKSYGVGVDYYIRHDFDRENKVGTWTLDYDRQSDLDDSVGFWRVTPIPGEPARSRVEYSVDIKLKGWVPGFVRGILVDNGLKQATTWVKVQSEKRVAK